MNKKCPYCEGTMTKYGKAGSGHQIWKCKSCKRKHIFSRKDLFEKSWKKKNKDVLLSNKRRGEYKYSRSTFYRHTKLLNLERVILPPVTTTYNQIFLDGIKFEKDWHCLIARVKEGPILFEFCTTESSKTWMHFLKKIQSPLYVTCDRHCGLEIAIKMLWNQAKVQTCLVHVHRDANTLLTKKPKTELGKKLKLLSSKMFSVQTEEDVDEWVKELSSLSIQYKKYLDERTYTPGTKRWHHTHQRDYRVINMFIKLQKRGVLFAYVYEKRFKIERDNNLLEGGINSPLKDLLGRHRGSSLERKCAIIEAYLLKRMKK